jgi:hypothetical protein
VLARRRPRDATWAEPRAVSQHPTCKEPTPGLSENDPQPGRSRGGPPVVLVVAIVVVVMIAVALHLAGVVGPGSN